MSAPTAPPGFGAPDDALLPGGQPRVGGPDTMLPAEPVIIRTATPARRSHFDRRMLAIIAIAVVAVTGVVLEVGPLASHGHRAAAPPTILAARPPFAGLPTSLEDIVRISAESARHTAMSTVISTAGTQGAPVTVTQLAAAQPSYQWLLGDQPSTTDSEVSIRSAPGFDVIAVAGTNREICAFAQWTPVAGTTYVTTDHQPNCAATAAPATGWSPLAGGSAQDLPNEDGS